MRKVLADAVRRTLGQSFINRHVPFSGWRREMADWSRARSRIVPRKRAWPPKKVFVVPSDPWAVNGSRGDDAMLSSLLQELKSRSPDVEVFLTTSAGSAETVATGMGFTALPLWGEGFSCESILTAIERHEPDCVFVVGADLMDGYYSVLTTTRMITILDLVVRAGGRGGILGFSFNANPAEEIRNVFETLSNDAVINVRDPISFGRFTRAMGSRAHLVADVAFLLKPDDVVSPPAQKCRDWCEERRAAGRRVVAVNIHPMLIKNATPEDIRRLVGSSSRAIERFVKERPVSVALIPHDYRERDRDDICLGPIRDELADRLGDELFFLEGEHSARQLKMIASYFDGVVSGRMHFAIASLGMGVPVGGLTYQDKFQGLLDHFGMSHDLLIDPTGVTDADRFGKYLLNFFDRLDDNASLVEARLSSIKAMSAKNFGNVGFGQS